MVSNTGSVEVTATCLLIRSRIVSWSGPAVASRFSSDSSGVAAVGTRVGLTALDEFGIGENAVFEVVNADRSGFAKTDRAEMAGDFEAVRVSDFDDGGEFVGREVHVGFERGHALGDPIFSGTTRVVGVFEFVHLWGERAGSLEVRSGDMDLGADARAGVDGFFQFEVGVWLDAAGRSNAGDAAGQVETRETCGVLRVHRGRAERRGIVHVVVHADEAGDYGATGEIEDFCAVGCFRR
jgi:hypothetical protein